MLDTNERIIKYEAGLPSENRSQGTIVSCVRENCFLTPIIPGEQLLALSGTAGSDPAHLPGFPA